MKLGAFSLSLSVKDIKKSKIFYEKLGFRVYAGDIKRNYLIMKSDTTLIGLFQGMFEGNIMTFNPGWDADANILEEFQDIRRIKKKLKDAGIPLGKEVDESGEGPASFTITDPDGNAIIIDQHV